MGISPRLHRKLQETLGAEAASDLEGVLEAMDSGQGEVRELRHQMELRFARTDERFAELRHALQLGFARTDERLAELRGESRLAVEKGLREQTRFFFLAWSVLLAAIVGLYAR